MKKYISFYVAALLIFVPLVSTADSYDGPFCYENPEELRFKNEGTNWDPSWYNGQTFEEYSKIRGTCKFVELTTHISLDPLIQNEYILGTHKPIGYECELWCEETKYSEIIQPTQSSSLTLLENLYGVTKGKNKYFNDTVVLLKKQPLIDWIQAHYSGSNLPKIVLLNKAELEKIRWFSMDDYPKSYIYQTLISMLGDKSTILVNDFLFTGTSTSLYTINFNEIGQYVSSIKNPHGENLLKENKYHLVDTEELPPDIGLIKTYGYKGRLLGYTLPVTSPVKSIEEYWAFSEKDGEIALIWEKTQYTLDDGSVKTESNTTITTSREQAIEAGPQENNDKNLLKRVWAMILSWFK